MAVLAGRYLREHVAVCSRPMTLGNSLHVTLKNVLPVLGRIPVTELERRHVSELHYPMRRTAAAATDAVNAPSRTFSRTDAWGTVPPGGNPCRGMRKHRTRRRGRFLTEHGFRRLGETLPEPEAEGRIGGDGRTGSLDADWLPRRVHRAEVGGRVAGPERDSARQIEDGPAHEIVPPPAVRVLVHLPRPAGTPWVIAGAKPGERLPQFNQHRYRVRKRARLEEVRLDDLRHGLASLAPTLGEPPPVIARLLGHGKIQTTARYAHLARDSVRDATDWAAASILPPAAPKARQ